ncbi:MAG: carboxypeptidase regulatory-like domain-containing protein [Bryobacteraceae bacterium]
MAIRLLAVCVLSILLSPLFGQGEAVNARLSGTVLDLNNAAVPIAKLTLSNAETGFTRQFTTTDTGQYSFPLIPPGIYQLKVEKTGFNTYVQPNIALTVGQSSTLNPKLEVGTVSQSVEVEADAPILNTGSSDVGSEVTTKQAVELPLNIRNVFGLVALDSSVNNSQQNQALNGPGSQGNVDQDIAFFNFGGGRFGTTAFLVDGHWEGAGDWDGIIFVPSVDELQEFKIQTNTFSPQYGWSMGNVVNAITKSGTRSIHGGVFEFVRNNNFDANNFFNNSNGLPRPQFKRNQFGFDVGGPIYLPKLYRQRDKTFFFASYEGLRQQTPTTLITTVPTAAQRTGDFSHTFNPNGSLAVIYNPFTTRQQGGTFVRDPFPGNQIPQRMIDSVAAKLLTYYPAPNRPGDPLTGQNNFVGSAGLPTDSDQYTIRVDHNISDNQHFFAKWSHKNQFKQLAGEFFGSNNPGGNGTIAPNPRQDAGIGYSNAISPSLVLSATFGFGRWSEGRKPQGVPFLPSTLGLPAALDSFGGPGAFPSVSVSGMQSLGSGGLNATPREARTYGVDVTKVRGSHTFSMGFMMIDFRLNTANSSQANFSFGPNFTQGPNPNSADPNTGFGVASFLLGTGGGSGITLNANAAFNKNFFGWYVNDDWKLRRNLTLNLGVRYDFQTAPTDRFDRLSYFSNARNSVSDQVGLNLPGGLRYTGGSNPRGVYDPQYTNVAPRLGITYSPFDKLVIRTGFGIFYTPAIEFGDYQGLSLNGFTQTTPFVGSVDGITPQNLLSNPFPGGLLLPPGKSAGDQTNLGLGINAVERTRPTPYVEQWMFGVQYQLAANTVLEANYVGNHGVKLPFPSFQRDQLRPELLSVGEKLLEPVPNPFYGVITAGSLAGKTIPRGQLLRPYPQYTSVSAVQPPGGGSSYNALVLSASRRFSSGLHFLVSYTASKYLTNTEGQEGWTNGSAQSVRNWYDTSLEKSLMIDDIPQSLVASYIYEFPVGKGKQFAPGNKIVDAAIGGWQIAGVSTFKSGFPLSISATTNNTNSLGGNQRPNLVGDPRLDHPVIDRWFNTGAFAQPPAFTFGNVPRTTPYLRAPGTNNFDTSLEKYWRLWSEQSKLQFRAEFYNLLNRTAFYAPNTTFGNANFGRITGALPSRSIQLGMKLYW